MNRDELLTKLAMELPDWPAGMDQGQLDKHMKPFWGSDWYCGATGDHDEVEAYLYRHLTSREDWLAERERLIKKPSWDEAPEWAEWLAQDSNGEYWWFRKEPGKKNGEWGGSDGTVMFASQGKVPAGHDWRETLEKRPVTTSLGAQTETRHDCQRCGGEYWTPPHDKCPCQEPSSYLEMKLVCTACGSIEGQYHAPECPAVNAFSVGRIGKK